VGSVQVRMSPLALLLVAGLARAERALYSLPSPWSYQCDRSNTSHTTTGHIIPAFCRKVPSSADEKVQGLAACKMTCGAEGMLWPAPSGTTQLSQELVHFLPADFRLVTVAASGEEVSKMVHKYADVMKEHLFMMSPDYEGGYKDPFPRSSFVPRVSVSLAVAVESEEVRLTTDTDESYTITVEKMAAQAHQQPPAGENRCREELEVKYSEENIHVTIAAPTYYGARHAMETLSQMISYDDLSDTLQIYTSAMVEDKPSFKHRGLLLDTSRNFMSKAVIKQIIRGMSYDKLNVFHWHITDTHSFPFYSRRVPQLTLHGAYSPRQVYTPEDVREIVEFARLRGVRVLPEFDAPAHVGNGWQWGEAEGKGRLAVCVNQEPWQEFCVEPPCGQLNPVNPHVYTTLAKLYQDFMELFDTDMFHMGGDEVNLNCWNSSQEVRDVLEREGKLGTEEELLALWKNFQEQAAEKVYEAAGRKLPLILWTNSLTEQGRVDRFLSNKDYVIQIWTTGENEVIKELIDKDYNVIFSNYDAWYLDCGYSAWVGAGNNWCSPYKGWQKIYENSPRAIYRGQGGTREGEEKILGGEAAMWSEQVDSAAVQHKLWPRVSALGERLWSDPEPGMGWEQAEIRMINHRARLVQRGILADALQPEWCHQNEASCYLKKSAGTRRKRQINV